MAEPAFYVCQQCTRSYERLEFKMRSNTPPCCPHCGSGEHETDQVREEAYVREVYGPIARALIGAVKQGKKE